jgi:purine-cytosine permease-like protein
VSSAKPDQDQEDIYRVRTIGNLEWDNVPYGILGILSGPVLAFFGYQYWHWLRVVLGCHLGYNIGWIVEDMFRKYCTELHYDIWINLTF